MGERGFAGGESFHQFSPCNVSDSEQGSEDEVLLRPCSGGGYPGHSYRTQGPLESHPVVPPEPWSTRNQNRVISMACEVGVNTCTISLVPQTFS